MGVGDVRVLRYLRGGAFSGRHLFPERLNVDSILSLRVSVCMSPPSHREGSVGSFSTTASLDAHLPADCWHKDEKDSGDPSVNEPQLLCLPHNFTDVSQRAIREEEPEHPSLSPQCMSGQSRRHSPLGSSSNDKAYEQPTPPTPTQTLTFNTISVWSSYRQSRSSQ